MKNLVTIKNKHHLKNPVACNCMTSGRKLLISNGIAVFRGWIGVKNWERFQKKCFSGGAPQVLKLNYDHDS